ncbi:transmembrane protein 79-like [Acanthaster planci]|uniref:Transmembrane protein 79-like n=1 Tax=Acanthaster planci TaxID=133434 RepID=A0A8B7ZG33_ACAPL|nr:transmembrane protein 79-like [Acanthaster planci]
MAIATVSRQQGQSMVLFFIGTGAVFVLCTVYVGLNYVPINVPNVTSLSERLVLASRWLVLSLLPMIYGVVNIAFTRFSNIETAGINPSLVISEHLTGMKQRALQNTLEQTVIHVAAVLALSTYLEGDRLKLVPISVFLFLCGRVTFYIGYLGTRNPLYRAFGFATTSITNIAVIAYGLYYLFSSGVGQGFSS